MIRARVLSRESEVQVGFWKGGARMSATAQPRYEFEKTEGLCPKKAWADARSKVYDSAKGKCAWWRMSTRN